MKIPLFNGKPHEIINLVKKYLLFCESINNKEGEGEQAISIGKIKRKMCEIIAQYTGIEDWLKKNPNIKWEYGKAKLTFLKETLIWCKWKLNISKKEIKVLVLRVQGGKEAREFNKLNKQQSEKRKILN